MTRDSLEVRKYSSEWQRFILYFYLYFNPFLFLLFLFWFFPPPRHMPELSIWAVHNFWPTTLTSVLTLTNTLNCVKLKHLWHFFSSFLNFNYNKRLTKLMSFKLYGHACHNKVESDAVTAVFSLFCYLKHTPKRSKHAQALANQLASVFVRDSE